MEILNQNQRRSALWRILGISVFILTLLGTGMFAMHNQYANYGQEDFDVLKEKYERNKNKWEGKETGYKNTIKKLRADLKKCEDGNNPDERLRNCEDRIKSKEDRIEDLVVDLQLCESRLAAATSY